MDREPDAEHMDASEEHSRDASEDYYDGEGEPAAATPVVGQEEDGEDLSPPVEDRPGEEQDSQEEPLVGEADAGSGTEQEPPLSPSISPELPADPSADPYTEEPPETLPSPQSPSPSDGQQQPSPQPPSPSDGQQPPSPQPPSPSDGQQQPPSPQPPSPSDGQQQLPSPQPPSPSDGQQQLPSPQPPSPQPPSPSDGQQQPPSPQPPSPSDGQQQPSPQPCTDDQQQFDRQEDDIPPEDEQQHYTTPPPPSLTPPRPQSPPSPPKPSSQPKPVHKKRTPAARRSDPACAPVKAKTTPIKEKNTTVSDRQTSGKKSSGKKAFQPTVVKPFNLTTDKRIEQRHKYDEKRMMNQKVQDERDRLEAKRREKEEAEALKEYRRSLVIKARPIQYYTPVTVAPSSKPPTLPEGPILSTMSRARANDQKSPNSLPNKHPTEYL